MIFLNESTYIYLIIINLASGFLFAYDKYSSTKNLKRIPEKTLHFFELLGGGFANIILMYIIRHKNRKLSFWIWTWLILIGWVLIIYFLKRYK